MTTGRVLPLDADELAACVSCGLCLPHCPTYRATGEEGRSPRGRIAAMRAVEEGAPIGPGFVEIMETCVVCRACETACPSSVPFGRLMEASRQAIAGRAVPWWQRAAYRTLEHPRLLALLTSAGGLAQRAHLMPTLMAGRLGLPRLPVRRPALRASGSDVWLFTGCVMDAWQRPVHAAAMAVLEAMGVGVALPGPAAGCCGALQAHAGLHGRAVRLARRVMTAFPGSAPILVDSAGCGAALKEYGRLLGDARAEAFSARVFDVQEWIAARAERLPAPALPGSAGTGISVGSAGSAGSAGWAGGTGPRLRVAVQDPCHLRHAQRAESHVRVVLRPYCDLVELGDEGRCCGAGGAFSVLQPELAQAIRAEKLAVIERAGADVVASPNPGCAMWLEAGGVQVLHPMEIVARAAGLLPAPNTGARVEGAEVARGR